MDAEREFILALTEQALKEWNDGTTEPAFPITPEDRENSANMLWIMAANAMAYGLMKGLDVGLKGRKGAAQ